MDGHGIRQYMRNITDSRQILTFYVDMFLPMFGITPLKRKMPMENPPFELNMYFLLKMVMFLCPSVFREGIFWDVMRWFGMC